MGIIPQLMSLGYGVFEKVSLDTDKEPIWGMLTGDSPVKRKQAVTLIREHEPEIVEAAESQEQYGQLQPIRVVELDDGTFDIVFGMNRAFAAAFNHAESPKTAPDTIEAMVMDKSRIKDIDLKFMGFAENNDRRNETPIDKAIFFSEIKKEHKLSPEDIGKKVGLSAQAIRNYLKLLYPKLEDKLMAIHEGELTIDKACKLLTKRLAGDPDDNTGSSSNGNRARMPSVKKLGEAFGAKKKPQWMEQKEGELFVANDVRKWLAHYLKKKFKPFSGELLTVEEPEPEAPAEAAKKVIKLGIPKAKAIRLLTALGKPESEGWTDKQLCDKLENIVNIAEKETQLEDASLQGLLDKLFAGYEKGVIVSIK